jgi:hypothetical protein
MTTSWANSKSVLTTAGRLLVAGVLICAGLAKALSGHSAGFYLPSPAYYGVAVVEVILAVIIVFHPASRWPLVVVVFMMLGGVGVAMVSRKPCGCFGTFLAQPRAHLSVAGICGAVASMQLILISGMQRKLCPSDKSHNQ